MGLLPGSSLTPSLLESLVRLGASVPFADAAALLAHFTGVVVGAETDRVAELERALPDAPRGPAVQLVSVDGAMAPLIGGEWAEVKTLVVGEVVAEAPPRATARSYFSRLTDAETFGRLATVETHRRGTTTAGRVVAVADGALWCQGFVDLHRPDAVRVLDFAHAVEHLGRVAQIMFGPGTPAGSEWLGVQAHRLRHGQDALVVTTLADLAAVGRRPEVRAALTATHAYLDGRREQIRDHAFAAAGYPIGSGGVESANKLVVEARRKGAGMHFNPLLALRALLANERWSEAWPGLWRAVCAVCAAARRPPASPAPVVLMPMISAPRVGPPPAPPPRAKTIVNGRPTADHPWKQRCPVHAKS